MTAVLQLIGGLPSKLNLVFICMQAPEQVDADFALRGSHTDVWGFGTCILHLATGQLPYQGLTQLQMVSAVLKRRLPDVPASLPEWLQQALKDCLSFDTAARPSVAWLHQVGQRPSTTTDCFSAILRFTQFACSRNLLTITSGSGYTHPYGDLCPFAIHGRNICMHCKQTPSSHKSCSAEF